MSSLSQARKRAQYFDGIEMQKLWHHGNPSGEMLRRRLRAEADIERSESVKNIYFEGNLQMLYIAAYRGYLTASPAFYKRGRY